MSEGSIGPGPSGSDGPSGTDYGAESQIQGHGGTPSPANPTSDGPAEAIALEKDAAGNPPGLSTAK